MKAGERERDALVAPPKELTIAATNPAYLVGQAALVAELACIAVCAIIVVVVALVEEEWTWTTNVELVFLLLGMVGVADVLTPSTTWEGHSWVGAPTNLPVYGWYAFVIAGLVGWDMTVRYFLGGSVLRCLSNWAVMVGSASSTNLCCSVLMSKEQATGSFSLAVYYVYQAVECWASLFGCGRWPSVLAQLAARRLWVPLCEGWAARWYYGAGYAEFFRPGAPALLFTGLGAMFSLPLAPDSVFEEEDSLEIAYTGKQLLTCPMAMAYPGRFIGASTWFLEQKVSMGSPWAVCGERMARGHLNGVGTAMLEMGMAFFRGTPERAAVWDEAAASYFWPTKRETCKLLLRDWVAGPDGRRNWVSIIKTPQPTNRAVLLAEGADEESLPQAEAAEVAPTLVSTLEFAAGADGKVTQKIGTVRATRAGALFYAR